MEICQAIRQRRSIRRFQNMPVEEDVLKQLVDLARLYASGGNLQPMKLAVITQNHQRDVVFSCLNWAMYLENFELKEHQRPMAYLVLLGDREIAKEYRFDLGAMATNVMLGAMEFGLASCCLAIPRKEPIRKMLALPESMEPEVVIALGYADCQSREVAFAVDQKYTLDANGDFLVPKRSAEDICLCSPWSNGDFLEKN